MFNEECGQIHTRTVSVAEMSAYLLSNGTVIALVAVIAFVELTFVYKMPTNIITKRSTRTVVGIMHFYHL